MMRNLVGALALLFTGGLVPAGEVIVPTDDTAFTVQKTDIVRLTGKGIAGSKIEVKVEGPAKVEATNDVRQLKNGKAVIGNSVKEFDLKPTDTGNVTVTITVTPPQPNAQPTATKYQF